MKQRRSQSLCSCVCVCARVRVCVCPCVSRSSQSLVWNWDTTHWAHTSIQRIFHVGWNDVETTLIQQVFAQWVVFFIVWYYGYWTMPLNYSNQENNGKCSKTDVKQYHWQYCYCGALWDFYWMFISCFLSTPEGKLFFLLWNAMLPVLLNTQLHTSTRFTTGWEWLFPQDRHSMCVWRIQRVQISIL